MNIPKSTAFELMNSLADEGLLQRNGKGRYRLGWRLFEFGQALLDTAEYRLEARETLWRLVEVSGGTSHLAVLDGTQAVYIEKLESARAVGILASPRIGIRLPAYCSGVGKVLLAYQEWDALVPLLHREEMRAFTPNTITTFEALAKELGSIRERGYGYEDEEVSIGVCCVAAPIRDAWNGVIAAVGLMLPTSEFREGKSKYTRAVLEAARRISGRTKHAAATCNRKRILQKV